MSLLLDALRKAEDARDRTRGIDPAAPPAPAVPAPAAAPSPAGPSPLVGLGLAVAIFVAVVSAWHSQPWRAPAKARVDPAALKLDYRLDLQRNSHRLTGPAGTPPQ